jgi:hypothetical protein
MRSFDYTVSDAFVMIRRQPCFARVSSAAIRRRMRESGVRRLTDPEGGKMKDRRRWPWPKSGWRYHKWGDYIGSQNPQSEYLYDDTHIDAVWTFHIYELVEGQYVG